MRPSQKSGRSRGKSNRNRGGGVGHSPNRVYESAGPEGKVRGTPQQVIDKYLSLARDSQLSGDRVTAENFLQHAEHYARILITAQEAANERRDQNQQQGGGDDQGGDNQARKQNGGSSGGPSADDDGQQPDQGRGGRGRREGGARAESDGPEKAEEQASGSAADAGEQPAGDGLAAIGDAQGAPEIVDTPESQAKPAERRPRRTRAKAPKPAADKADEPSTETAE